MGYNSRPDAVKLPEPSLEKFWRFYDALSEFTEVKLKDTRGKCPKFATEADIAEQSPENISSDVEWQKDVLASDERMDFEERAGIMEYDGGLTRDEAEKRALEIIVKRRA